MTMPPAELLTGGKTLLQGLDGGLLVLQRCLNARSAALRLLSNDYRADDCVIANAVTERTTDKVADRLVRRRLGCFVHHGPDCLFGNEGLEASGPIGEAVIACQCLGARPIGRL